MRNTAEAIGSPLSDEKKEDTQRVPSIVWGSTTAVLTQLCQNHYCLSGIVPRHFYFSTALGELIACLISRHPDLGKEILIAILPENKLGLHGLQRYA